MHTLRFRTLPKKWNITIGKDSLIILFKCSPHLRDKSLKKFVKFDKYENLSKPNGDLDFLE